MDNFNDESNAAQSSYNKIEEKVKVMQAKIKWLNKDKPKDLETPELNLNPPGLTPPGILPTKPGTRKQVAKDNQQIQEQLKADTWKQTDQDLQKIIQNKEIPEEERKSAQVFLDKMREEIHPNIYLTMDETDKKEAANKSKDIEESQNYMASLLSAEEKIEGKTKPDSKVNATDKSLNNDINQSQEKMNVMLTDFKKRNGLEEKNQNASKETIQKEDNKNLSMSTRFSQSLSYTKSVEGSDNKLTPITDKDGPDKD